MKSLARAVALALCLLVSPPHAGAAEVAAGTAFTFPDEATIRTELRAFIERHRGAPGVVVGIIEPGGRRVIAEGQSGQSRRRQLDGATRFETGSITKTFTGLLLADMILKGEVSANQQLGELFPPEIPLTNGVEKATLEQLATHSSGLPRLSLDPRTVLRLFSVDPYRGSSAEDVLRSVANCPDFQLKSPGSFAYSNLGYAALGRLLERRAGQPYEQLLRDRVLKPLGLSGIATAHAKRRPVELAVGHGPGGRPVRYWNLDGYSPAGCLIASTDEMLEYLARYLEGSPPSVVEAQRQRWKLRDGSGIGLAWIHDSIAGQRMIWHNGGTGGFRSFAAFFPDEKRALVILANGQGNVDALARSLIDPMAPGLAAHKRSASAILQTIWFLALGPLLLIGPIRGVLGLRRGARAGAEGAESAPPAHRHQVRGLNSIDRMSLALGAAIPLTLAERMGAWKDIPFVLWWATVALVVAGYLWLEWRSRRLPPTRVGTRSLVGKCLVLVVLAGALWVLYQ